MVNNRFILLILLFTLLSCKDKGCGFDDGNNGTRTLDIGNFTSLKVFANAEVLFHTDTVDRIVLEGPELLLENFTTEWESDKAHQRIRIFDENKCNFLRNYDKVRIHVYEDTLQSFVSQGSVKALTVDTIKASQFVVVGVTNLNEMDLTVNTGRFHFYNFKTVSGIYTFRGITKTARLSVYANARLNSTGLVAEKCNVDQYSVVDAYVGEADSLIVAIYSSGNVYYEGNPGIRIVAHTGTGKLISLDNE